MYSGATRHPDTCSSVGKTLRENGNNIFAAGLSNKHSINTQIATVLHRAVAIGQLG